MQVRDFLSKNRKLLINSLGGVDNTLSLLNQKSLWAVLNYNSLNIIMPWSMEFYIGTVDPTDIQNSAIFTEPYEIRDSNNKLIYRVSNHNGIFGRSILDRSLILQSKTGDTYLLAYKSYSNELVIEVIVVNLSTNLRKSSFLYSTEKPSAIKTDENNYIYLDASNTQLDTSSIGSPYFPIQIYTLQTKKLSFVPTEEYIINNYTSLDTYKVGLDKSIFIYPKNSQWILIKQNNVNLRLSNITGAGTNRLIPSTNNIYYVSASADSNLNLIRQSLGLVPDLPPQNVILQPLNIRARLIL